MTRISKQTEVSAQDSRYINKILSEFTLTIITLHSSKSIKIIIRVKMYTLNKGVSKRLYVGVISGLVLRLANVPP